VVTISSSFRTRSGVSDKIDMTAPENGKLIVKMEDSKPMFFDSDWMGIHWDNKAPFFDITDDSLMLNTVRINVIKSKDSAWHLQREKLSRGSSSAEARDLASRIDFPIVQKDSLLLLASGFSIKPSQQFHNQQVLLVIEMPLGKKIYMDRNLDEFHWFNISRRWRNNGVDIDWNDSDDDNSSWDTEVEYIMTENGLEKTGKSIEKDDSEDRNSDAVPDSGHKKNDSPAGDYRYHKPKTTKSVVPAVREAANTVENGDPETGTSLILLTKLS
jgi:hypothetical protein